MKDNKMRRRKSGMLLTNKHLVNPRVLDSDKLSDEDNPDIEAESFRVFIGNRPTIRDLRELTKIAKKKLPEKLQGLKNNKLLLVETTVAVWQVKGFRGVTSVGFEISYPAKPYVTVRDILPQSQYVKKLGGALVCNASVSINGKFSNPVDKIGGQILETLFPSVKIPDIPLLPKIEANFGGTGEAVCNFSFNVGTKTINAFGDNRDHCIWSLKKGQ